MTEATGAEQNQEGDSKERPPSLKSYFIFITGGAIGALTNWTITIVLTSIFGVHYLVSYPFAQVINIAINFTWQRHVTFKVRDQAIERASKFLLLSGATALLNICMVFIVTEHVLSRFVSVVIWGKNLNYMVAIISVTMLISVINFLVSHRWVFRPKHKSAKD